MSGNCLFKLKEDAMLKILNLILKVTEVKCL